MLIKNLNLGLNYPCNLIYICDIHIRRKKEHMCYMTLFVQSAAPVQSPVVQSAVHVHIMN